MKSAQKVLGLKSKEDAHEDNGVLFWVNKSGFPIDEQTWERMWDHVAKIHPDGHEIIQKVRRQRDLPQVPPPQAPLSFPPGMAISERIMKIQNYMKELQYNHTGTQFFEIRKNRPLSGLMECAREMIREALPIKCLEAVILAVFLTNGMLGVERFTLSFKTVFKGQTHRHVVLGISHGGRYGSIGMSRRDDLMYKPIEFKTLADLFFDFERCYLKYWHTVKKVKVGLPIVHDQHSYEVINWKTLLVSTTKSDRKEIARDLDAHARRIKSLSKSWTTGPYGSLKMLNTAEAVRDLQPSMESNNPGKLRRSQTLEVNSPEGVRRKKSSGSPDNGYQIRI